MDAQTPSGIGSVSHPTIQQSDAKKLDMDSLAKLSSFDEPMILQHGGKWVRTYVREIRICFWQHNEACAQKDREARILFENCFANSVFKHLFEMARRGHLGIYPNWIPRYCMGGRLCDKLALQQLGLHSRKLSCRKWKLFCLMQQYGKGLIVLMAIIDGHTCLDHIGESRMDPVLKSISYHPTLKYVLKGITEIVERNLEMYSRYGDMDMVSYTKNHRGRWMPPSPAEWLKVNPALSLAYNKLVNEFELATFKGDFDWFKQRFGNPIVDDERFLISCENCCMGHREDKEEDSSDDEEHDDY